MTIQAQIKATLEKSGIPSREIEVYGSQIVITSACRDTAEKWGALLSGFSKVRGILESIDEAKIQKGSCMNRTYIKVWRTFAAMVD
jgi:hypothetical protein